MKLPPLTFTVLDTETTGLTPKVHRVIEFASVRVESGKKVDEYEELFSTDDTLPPLVQTLTRITPNDLEGRKTIAERREHILERIGNKTIIVGQNVSFDMNMLKGEGIDLSSRPWIDTSMLASLVYPELESYSLSYISSVLNLNHEPVHRALGDVHATLELLSCCWNRLLELPEDLRQILKQIMKQGDAGYRAFFGALPQAGAEGAPEWLLFLRSTSTKSQTLNPKSQITIPASKAGTVQLAEEPLNPDFLNGLLQQPSDCRRIVAVKNLEHVLRNYDLPDGVAPLLSPSMLTNPEAVEMLATQEEYTADEATLATKLAWYEPQTKWELPLHGGEKSIWSGKAACTDQSAVYRTQFDTGSNTLLIDHTHLLWILSDKDHPGRQLVTPETHLIFADASMLEDTASRALGASVNIDTLRASGEGNKDLTGFCDLLQIWIERVRRQQDIYYIEGRDVEIPEVSSLKERIAQLRESADLPGGASWQLLQLERFLCGDPRECIMVIETQGQSQKQYLTLAPRHVGQTLKESVYDGYPTTLLIPKGSRETLSAIVPPSVQSNLVEIDDAHTPPSVAFVQTALHKYFDDPPMGKTVVLVNSKRSIEDLYVRFDQALEEKGYTLVCQGTSGGQGRMQAEFGSAEGNAILVVTPWQFEGFELPADSVDHLIIHALPFDHPNHVIVKPRSESYQNPFIDYSLPRLEHRLFRLVRTFCRFATKKAGIHVLDERIESKKYGGRVRGFLEDVCRVRAGVRVRNEAQPSSTDTVDPSPNPSPKKPKKKKQKDDSQLSLF